MPIGSSRNSSQRNVSAYRQRLRDQCLKTIQFWVPDVRTSSFKREAHRQTLAVAGSGRAKDDQSFIDVVSALKLDEDR